MRRRVVFIPPGARVLWPAEVRLAYQRAGSVRGAAIRLGIPRASAYNYLRELDLIPARADRGVPRC